MTLLKLLSLFFWLVFIASQVMSLRNWKKTVFVNPRAILSGQTAALVSQWVYATVAQHPLGMQSWLLLLLPGLAGGILYGKFVKINQTVRGIAMNYARPNTIIWTALMAVTQLVTIFTGSVPTSVFGLSVLSLGINLGLNGKVLLNYRQMIRQAVRV